MKRIAASLLLTTMGLYSACNKENTNPTPTTSTTANGYDSYSSMQSFYAKNGVQMQAYSVSGLTGGSFITPKGTKVIVPANCFIDQSSHPVTGSVTIEFKDLYTKSDMLLSNMPPEYYNTPLKSGGEFFICAKYAGSAVYLTGSKPITILQPFNGWSPDVNMVPFLADTAKIKNWIPASFDSVGAKPTEYDSTAGYVFSLYSFSNPVDSGTWCNSDNSNYFSAYTQTSFTIQTTDSTNYNTAVFLLFNNLSSMVHVYMGSTIGNTTTFPYSYAPVGLPCTVVAIEIMNNGQLRCAFVPTTITASGTVNFTCSPSTTSAFETKLNTFNH